MRKLTLSAIALAASTMIGSTASYADLMGEVWLNETAVASNLALFPGGLLTPRDGLFISTSLNYSSPPGAGTIGGFLDGFATNFTIPAGSSVTTVPELQASNLQNAVFRFTGAAFGSGPGGTFDLTHDDGICLNTGINSNCGTTGSPIINEPLPTTPHTHTNVPLAPQNITLLYGECCGLPAQLIAPEIHNAVPEPASLALLGAALIGLAPILRRRRKTG